MSNRQEEGRVLADSDQEAEETFLLGQAQRIFPIDSCLIAEEEEVNEVQDEDIISIEEIEQ
jgi:hypothetical protein